MRIRGRVRGWLLGAALAALAGCGSGDELPRQAVSGTVSLDGKPLEDGMIQFFPAAPSEHAVAAGTTIKGGRYAIARAEGPVPGTYKVMISGAGGKEKAAPGESSGEGEMPGLGPLHPPDLVPERYNAKTELTANVTPEGPNEFKFDLKSR
jgi:hypothetical protein